MGFDFSCSYAISARYFACWGISHLFLFVFTISMFQKVAFADTIKEIADYALKSNAAMVRCGGSRLCW